MEESIHNIKELKDVVEKKNPSSVKEMRNIIEEAASKLPDTTKKIKGMQQSRGALIDMAIAIEAVYNEIILQTDAKDKVSLPFREKTRLIKEIITQIDKEKKIKEDFFDKLDRIVTIRNLYAHVPTDYFSNEIEFDKKDYYYNEKSKDLKNKTLRQINREFVDICSEIKSSLDEILVMIYEYVQENPSNTF